MCIKINIIFVLTIVLWNKCATQTQAYGFESSEEWPMHFRPPPLPLLHHRWIEPGQAHEYEHVHLHHARQTPDFMFPDTGGDITFPNAIPVERERGGGGRSRGREQGEPLNGRKARRRNQRICERKYAEYVERIFPNEADTIEDANDIDFDGRELAAPGEYPHMVAIGFPIENSKVLDYKCGGSLISENFVATAAHCTNFTGAAPTKVRIGDLNLKTQEGNVQPQTRRIAGIHNHPSYDANSYYNDIALLQLASAVQFTEFVRPIRLWVHSVFPYSIAFAMGYGATSFGKERTNRLTHMNMTIVPNDECNGQMPEMPEAEMGIIESQICALDYKNNRDTCQGDSGGPLQLNLHGRRFHRRKHYHLIGITSYGLYCRSGYPSVYTRISSYIDWIEGIVWPRAR